MSFTKAAYRILKTMGRYQTAEYLTSQVMAKGLLVTRGKTLERTMYAALHDENKRRMRKTNHRGFFTKMELGD